MQTFASTDLKQTLGDVLHATNNGPVAITRHNKTRYVIMTIEEFERRVPKDERRSYATAEMPPEHLELLDSLDDDTPEDEK